MTEQEQTPNPALAPEASSAPVEKRYRVTGVQSVLGYEPGSDFTAALDPITEKLFLDYGHLQLLSPSPAPEGAPVEQSPAGQPTPVQGDIPAKVEGEGNK